MGEKKITVERHPVTRYKSGFEARLNGHLEMWSIPTMDTGVSPLRAYFHLNAYGLAEKGYDGRNTTISIIDSCFYKAYDCTNLVVAENDISGGNNIWQPFDGSDCFHGTEIWSLLTGRGECTNGILPAVSINAREINIENNLLTDVVFAKSLYGVGRGSIIVFSFVAVGDYDKTRNTVIIRRTVKSSAERGAVYFASAGNSGSLQNRTSETTCLDSTLAGMPYLFPIAANCPSGSCWYTEVGCIAFSAPGGDDSSCLIASDGDRCTCVAGTSFAAPYAGSVAAAMQQVCNNTLTGMDIYDAMVRSSTTENVDLKDGALFLKNGGGVLYSRRYGHGLLNMGNAIDYVTKNNCPHVPSKLISCFTERVIVNATGRAIGTVDIAPPTSCSIKTVVFVKVYAVIPFKIFWFNDWYISSPQKSIPCTLLPKQHPYMQDSLDIETGCREFYREPYSSNGTWSVHYNIQYRKPSRTTYMLEIMGWE